MLECIWVMNMNDDQMSEYLILHLIELFHPAVR